MRLDPETRRELIAGAQEFLRRHWQQLLRLREKLRISEDAVHLLLAGGAGILGGLVNVVFYLLTDTLKVYLLRHRGDWAEIAALLPEWQRALLPVLGGLMAGSILYWGVRLVRTVGSTNLLEVVVVGDGRLPFRDAVLKAASSLVTISTGGSICREGPLVHLSATLASKCGQLAGWQPYRLRLLVACGASAGIAAAYNAPVAGAVFAAQIVLGSFSMHLFAPLVVASVVSTMVSRTFFGIEPWYRIPTSIEFTRIGQLPAFMVLGALAGALGAGFLAALRQAEAAFQRLNQPVYIRLVLAGIGVGIIAIGFPEVWGNGYGPTNDILHGRYDLVFLPLLFLAKFLATLLTVGAGAVGGVFTPTLFLGAGLGAMFGLGLHAEHLALDLPIAAFALVGMGSVLSATTHSPLLAIIMVFEIALNYTLAPPLMVACVVATLVARRFSPDSIYTEPLRRKGIDLDRESVESGAATRRTVAELMRAPVPPLKLTADFREIADRFLTSPNNYLPVVDKDERLVGLVALQDLKQYLHTDQELSSVIAYDVMRPPPPCLTPDQILADAVPILLASEQRNVPVVNTQSQRRLMGAVVRAEALGLLAETIATKTSRSE